MIPCYPQLIDFHLFLVVLESCVFMLKYLMNSATQNYPRLIVSNCEANHRRSQSLGKVVTNDINAAIWTPVVHVHGTVHVSFRSGSR